MCVYASNHAQSSYNILQIVLIFVGYMETGSFEMWSSIRSWILPVGVLTHHLIQAKVISISITCIKLWIWGLVSSLNNLNNVVLLNSDSQSKLNKLMYPNFSQLVVKTFPPLRCLKKTSSESQHFSCNHQATASTCWRHDLSSTTMDGIRMQSHIHQVEANASILDVSSSHCFF